MIDKFLEVCNSFITFTFGEKRDGKDRRVKKTRKKNTIGECNEKITIDTINDNYLICGRR